MVLILYRFLALLARLAVRSGRSKDLEIIVLRHQVTVPRRQLDRPSINDDDRSLLGAIAAALPRRLREGWIVTPSTLLRWHPKRIARHWTQPHKHPGRPSADPAVVSLIVQMATNNPTWGYRRITGELKRVGHKVGASTVWRILKQHNIDPSPNRADVTWTQFLRSQAAVACDFATIERPSCAASTCCSSSTSPAVRSSSPASRPTQPGRGRPKPPATCSSPTPTASNKPGRLSVTAEASSPPASTRSSAPNR
ncbi:MAG: transposase [Actinomycetia bacterium]|nr:transposase [Actinomycetes bacterium]